MRTAARVAFEAAFCPLVIFGSLGMTWLARRHEIGWVEALFFSSLAPIVVITALEWLHPYRADWNYPFRTDRRAAFAELGKDLAYVAVITRIHSWTLPWILPRLAPLAKVAGKKLGIYGIVSPFHPWIRVALVLIVAELFWYWGHRLQHTLPFLWRFHSTHHVPTRLSALKAARNHPVDMLFLNVVSYVPLAAMGVRPTDMMWAALVQSVVNVTSHANVKMRSGVFSWLFATPDYHRVHHSADMVESQSNYGCRLLVWDRIFGTFRRKSALGDDIVVGVAPVRARTFKEELVDPFYKPMIDGAPTP